MATLCKDCHRPFAYTAHEETLPSHCQENGSYGCIRAQLTQAQAEIAALRACVEASVPMRGWVLMHVQTSESAGRMLDAFDAAYTSVTRSNDDPPDCCWCGLPFDMPNHGH